MSGRSGMDVNSKIQSAAALMRAGRLTEGAELCRQVLAKVAGHPGALHLLALAARDRGDSAEAEALFKQALSRTPRQAGLLVDFGRFLRSQERLREAEKMLRRAVEVAPDMVIAWHSLALTLHSNGSLDEAARCARKAVTLQPTYAPGWELLTAILQQRNDLAGALAACRDGLRHAADAGRLHYALAQVLREDCSFAEAATAYEAARRNGYEPPDLYRNLGEARFEAGDIDGALAVFTAGTSRFPEDALLHRLRARFHFESGAAGDPVAALWQAARAQPRHAQLWQVLVDLLNRLERYAESRAALDEARRLDCPQTAELALVDAILCARTGQTDRATALFADMERNYPRYPGIKLAFAEHLLGNGDPARAEALCGQVLAETPHEQLAWALRGTAWQLLGDPREAWLLDYEAMVVRVRVPPPDQISSASFFRDLEGALETQHRSRAHPIEQTLRGGTQTNGFLFRLKDPLLRVLEAQIRLAVREALDAMPSVPGHPFWGRQAPAGRDAGFQFAGAWSVRLSSQGFHTNHVHPAGWVSSALYIALPTEVRQGPEGPGCLQFGVPPTEMGLVLPPRRIVRPEVGELALFPSYMWHGTVPFESKEPRVAVAFDLVPTQ